LIAGMCPAGPARLRVRTLDEARMTPLHVGLLVQPAIS
jgi:hypothetical protein